MDLDSGTVQRDHLEPNAQELFALQVGKDPVEDAALGPPIHPGVDGVPGAKPGRQTPPLAPVLGDIQDGIEHLQIGEADIAALHGETRGKACVLGFGEFHP